MHGKDEIPSLDIKIRGLIIPGKYTGVNVGVNEIRSENNVRDLRLDSRKCRFSDEPERGSYYGVNF